MKALNTVTAFLMVNPGLVGNGDHTIFVSGNDAAAKAQATEWLKGWFGWKDVIDLGDITTARGTEMYLPIWLRLWVRWAQGCSTSKSSSERCTLSRNSLVTH